MARRMTIVFDDEELYTALKVAAARSHRPAKDLVADALGMYFRAIDGLDGAHSSTSTGRTTGAEGRVDRLLQELGLGR
jgi:hypothetical protein